MHLFPFNDLTGPSVLGLCGMIIAHTKMLPASQWTVQFLHPYHLLCWRLGDCNTDCRAWGMGEWKLPLPYSQLIRKENVQSRLIKDGCTRSTTKAVSNLIFIQPLQVPPDSQLSL